MVGCKYWQTVHANTDNRFANFEQCFTVPELLLSIYRQKTRNYGHPRTVVQNALLSKMWVVNIDNYSKALKLPKFYWIWKFRVTKRMVIRKPYCTYNKNVRIHLPMQPSLDSIKLRLATQSKKVFFLPIWLKKLNILWRLTRLIIHHPNRSF